MFVVDGRPKIDSAVSYSQQQTVCILEELHKFEEETKMRICLFLSQGSPTKTVYRGSDS